MSHPAQPTQPSLSQQRQYSPAHLSPSPNTPAGPSYSIPPPSKRPKMSMSPVNSPQPHSPYSPSPTITTSSATIPPTGLTSPAYSVPTISNVPSQSQMALNRQNGASVANGNTSLTMPSSVPIPRVYSPQPPTSTATTSAPYSTATLAPIGTNPTTASIGNMGPPAINTSSSFSSSIQPAKAAPSKQPAYDMDDMLMGTGIDLDEEAEIMNSLESRTGFRHHAPGRSDSFYGAGPANQAPEPTGAKTNEELAAEIADQAWNDAARRLAVTQTNEILHNLLEPGVLHKRFQAFSHKHGVELNLDIKPDGRQPYLGRFAQPYEFPKPEIKVLTQTAPDGAIVQTEGSFIPKDAFLVDQIALLSIGTKQYLKDLLGDANQVATIRQQTSHGEIPPEWIDAALGEPLAEVNGAQSDNRRTGIESAVSPRTNPLKRSADEISNGLPTPISEAPPPNLVIEQMVGNGKECRNAEERRLRKRQKLMEKNADLSKDADGGARAGSVAPGTPGSIAPEQAESKAPTKKEGKKAAAKAAEAASSTTVNQTLGLFAGGKKKKYSWMTAGAPGSGASTPRPQALGAPSSAGSTAASSTRAPRGPLTKAGVTYLGQLREDSEKGKNIQLRDLVVALEERGHELKTLQTAYVKMDKSDTGDKITTADSPI